MSYWLGCTCPYCDAEVEIFAGRWNGKYQCVSCNIWIKVNFDFIYCEEFEDEWDLHDYELLTEENDYKGLDIFNCRLCLE